MPVFPGGPAPYPPSGKLIDLIERHRSTGLPTPLTTARVARLINSDALAPRTLKALELLDLIDGNGEPTAPFEALTGGSNDEFKERLAETLRAGYADVFQYIDPAQASADELEKQFRNYEPRGQLARMIACFRGLCEYAGIMQPQERETPEQQTASRNKRQRERRRVQGTGSTANKPEQRTKDPAITDAKSRYLDLLLKQADENPAPELFDRIERVLGVAQASAPATGAASPNGKGGEGN